MDVSSRQITCERCGAGFSCSVNGACWCGEEAVRLPLPEAGQSQFNDCLCRACLRAMAEEAGQDADSAGVPRAGG
ncbi:MAG TPA: cysteine-rich CWC family protein [Hyphomonadaceae bacterium]|nr:cysteine-rich CWC family protein [Hyphomonadaceae bacterium]